MRERPPGIRPPSLNHVSALYALRHSLFFSSFLHKVMITIVMMTIVIIVNRIIVIIITTIMM